jgi:hypothetical protein
MSYREIMALTVEEAIQLSKAIRSAERIEDQRWGRRLAPLSYAVWFNQAKPSKRPKIEKYLRDLGLEEEVEEMFLWEIPGVKSPQAKRVTPQETVARAAKVEKWVEERDKKALAEEEDPTKGWGDMTIVDLQAYRTEEAKRQIEERRRKNRD